MKKVIFLLMMLLVTNSGAAQTLTADEMIEKTKCRSFDCYNSFIINKGFSFDRADNKNNYDSYLFLSDVRLPTNNTEITTKNSSIILIYNDGSCDVGFRTAVKNQYQALIDGFKNEGFTISNTLKTDNGGVNTTYDSRRHPGITLLVLVEQLSGGNGSWTSYDFQVVK